MSYCQNCADLEKELHLVKAAAGFCDKHKPNGSSRNCLVCACEKLSFALSRISYLCGKPNEMKCSDYDTHFNEDEVVKQVESLKAAFMKCAKVIDKIHYHKHQDVYCCTCGDILDEAYKDPHVQSVLKQD